MIEIDNLIKSYGQLDVIKGINMNVEKGEVISIIGASGSGNTRGSGIADTRLNGSGNYQTRFVNTDDYRAQEFPNGSATTIATYYLRINKS